MRAWQVQQHGSPKDALRMAEIDPPVPRPGEVRLRIRAAAVGLPDAFMCRSNYRLTPKSLPFVPGQEVCGVVDAVGEGVDVPIGARLMAVTSFMDGHGGFADYALARTASAYRVPDAMSDVDAASFRIGFATAWIGLVRRANLQPDEWLVVLGAAGGSGATAVQLGRALGARVVAVASGPEKVAFCRKMGAHVVIDRTAENVRDRVLDATDQHGADVVYDPVGGAAGSDSTRYIAYGGRLLAVGFASGEWVKVDTAHVVQRNYALVGVYASGLTREQGEADHEALLSLAAEGKLDSFATVVGFAEIPAAVEAVGAGTVIGKMVARVSPE